MQVILQRSFFKICFVVWNLPWAYECMWSEIFYVTSHNLVLGMWPTLKRFENIIPKHNKARERSLLMIDCSKESMSFGLDHKMHAKCKFWHWAKGKVNENSTILLWWVLKSVGHSNKGSFSICFSNNELNSGSMLLGTTTNVDQLLMFPYVFQ